MSGVLFPAISGQTSVGPEFDLGPIDGIPLGEGREFDAGDSVVAVFRTREGALYATQARCPHQGGKLADGLVGGGQVICPLHANRYELCSGRALNSSCDALLTFPIWLDAGGHIILQLERYPN